VSQPEGAQRRIRTGIVLGTLASSALFFAMGSSQLVASAFLDVPRDPAAAPGLPLASATDTAPLRGERALEPVLTRNMFDSVTGSLTWNVEVPVVEPVDPGGEITEPVIVDPNGPHPVCEGSVRLVGSYVRHGAEDQSFAAVINATGTSLLYRVGMSVDDREVLAVERNRVVLRANGALCDLNMFGAPPPVAVAAAQPAAAPIVIAEPPSADTGGIEASDLDANIHQVSDTSYTVNRGLVDRLLANQAALMSAARVIPHEEDGRTVGMKIYGIRRSSLLGRLGIQNGDMLRTINGFDLTDPTALLQAYTTLRSADHLSMQVMRRGQPMSMDYQIQ
jgi:general secretion pathway protein C